MMALTRLPGIEYAAMPRAGTKASALPWPPRLVVVHDTGNSGSSRYDEASYAANRTDSSSSWTSAHAYIDRGGVLGSLPLNLQAWAAYSYANSHGFHLEICLRDLHNPDAMQWAAWFVMRLCQEAGIPMRKLTPAQVAAGERGVCGHYDITVGLGVGDHTDPSWSAAEWVDFMARVNGGDDMGARQDAEVSNANRYGWAMVAGLPKIGGIYNPDNLGAGTTTVDNWTYATLLRVEAKADAALKALGMAQADIDELQARPVPTFDLPALAAALAPLLDGKLDAAAVLGVLESPEGQAALVQAANSAEDS